MDKIFGGVQDAKLENRRPVQYQVTFKHATCTAAVEACRVSWLRADCSPSPLSTSILCRRLQRAKIPDAV